MEDEPRYCFICGRNGNGDPLERHHIFGGSNRKWSEKYGLVIWLCGNRCHRNGKYAVHNNKNTADLIHAYGQVRWMEENNGTTEDFIKIFGRNYV